MKRPVRTGSEKSPWIAPASRYCLPGMLQSGSVVIAETANKKIFKK
jgi:hypothetical protein